MCKLKKGVKKVYDIHMPENTLEENDDCESFYISMLFNVSEKNDSTKEWFQLLSGEFGNENFKLDTGADINVLSFERFLALGYKPNIIYNKDNIKLQSYSGDIIPIKGLCNLNWWYKDKMHNLRFAIANIRCQSVLGRETCSALGLIQRVHGINYAQSNGKSERAVQTIKNILKKSLDSGTDFYLDLLSYRNTPRDNLNSPAQLLMGRRLNCKLPVHPDLLKRNYCNDEKQYNTLLEKQRKVKMYYDKHSKPLPELDVGDDVIMIEKNKRMRGKVIAKASTPRSYIIKNKKGIMYRRNRQHLIKSLPICEDKLTNANVYIQSEEEDEYFSDESEYVPSDESKLSMSKDNQITTYSPPLTRSKAKKLGL
ncbi:uncharacterized protein LOC126380910 [Pectinophora gossypiella]|uniref:uncharacterized protein LOC126380910 n=1 Tax=Pectinophora gossypiella TaxID=13191 RepID=UPI00214F37D8|nr:uncharacterized protein LOC126380910 [Pectinophora gossypiella]